MRVCKYCGREYPDNRKIAKSWCGTCNDKVSLLPKFVQARDDLRELCGLERMYAKHERYL